MDSGERIIMGIDPGTTVLGYGIIQCIPHKTPVLLALGVLELHKFEDHYVRLKRIFDRAISLIDEFHPDELAIESPFYSKNVQSMLKLGRAQGTVITAALSRSIPVFEYAPRKIKLAVTGKGAASKEQVAAMLQHMLQFEDLPKYLDATDGLAAAMCHYFQNDQIPQKKPARKVTASGKSWAEYVQNHPKRVVKSPNLQEKQNSIGQVNQSPTTDID